MTESAGRSVENRANLVSRRRAEEGTYLPPIGVVLAGTEVIPGREMLRDFQTDLVCAEGPAVVKYFGDEESPQGPNYAIGQPRRCFQDGLCGRVADTRRVRHDFEAGRGYDAALFVNHPAWRR